MHKKGQLSIIIIIGLVLVIGTALVLYANNKPTIEAPAALDPMSAAQAQLQSCWSDAATNAVTRIGIYGGTLVPEIIGQPSLVRLAVKNGKNTVPTLQELEKEISYGVIMYAAPCEEKASMEANAQGLDLELGRMEVQSLVGPELVIVSVNSEDTFVLPGIAKKVQPYQAHIKTQVGRLAAFANYLADGAATKGTLDIFSVIDAGVTANAVRGPAGVLGVTLKSIDTAGTMPSTWLLAFDQTNKSPRYAPQVKQPQPITAPVGVHTTGAILALDISDEPITFKANSPIVNLDEKTGVYDILPAAYEKGTHPVIFTVTNLDGLSTDVLAKVIVQ